MDDFLRNRLVAWKPELQQLVGLMKIRAYHCSEYLEASILETFFRDIVWDCNRALEEIEDLEKEDVRSIS